MDFEILDYNHFNHNLTGGMMFNPQVRDYEECTHIFPNLLTNMPFELWGMVCCKCFAPIDQFSMTNTTIERWKI
jgi:hypothetical protein